MGKWNPSSRICITETIHLGVVASATFNENNKSNRQPRLMEEAAFCFYTAVVYCFESEAWHGSSQRPVRNQGFNGGIYG